MIVRLRRRAIRLLGGLGLAAAIFLGPLGASAQQGVVPTNGGVLLNFQDVDIAFLFTALALAADLNLVYHDLPTKAITLRSQAPVAVAELPALMRSIARANGITVAEEGGYMWLSTSGDEDEPADLRELFIYRLRHSRASVLAGTLSALFGGQLPGGGAAQRPQLLSQQISQLQATGQAAQQFAPQPQSIVINQAGAGGLDGNVLVIPDEVTNSLLIRATPNDYALIVQALQSLDLRPLQVVIEVVIAEVRRTDDLSLGTTFEVSSGPADRSIVGSLLGPVPTAGGTLNVITLGDVNVDATLQAMAATGDVRVLSRPVILAQNNQEATIFVGAQRPFIQVSQTNDLGSQNEIVQYLDVGTGLTILPTINEDGYVNLALAQSVMSASAEVQFGAPIINTKEASTQLLARNGQTVVVGGLVDRQLDEVHRGIPILKDIPVLGYLFGFKSTMSANSELFLFLTPYIVASDEDADLLRQTIEDEAELIGPILPDGPLAPTPLPTAPGGAAAQDAAAQDAQNDPTGAGVPAAPPAGAGTPGGG